MHYYAGIGSRKTPSDILEIMWEAAKYLAKNGYTLRSGGAERADTAFEEGALYAEGKREIFLPWSKYNGNMSQLCVPTKEALDLTAQYHPAWQMCSLGARKLHARNAHIVLGLNLDTPVKFILCWTENGKGQGGTGQALRIAKPYKIPVHDFGTGDLDWKYILTKKEQ